MLRQFHFIDQNGKDQGINVRNRAKELADLLGDVEKIRAERKKARSNRNKFGGVEGGAGLGGGMTGSGFSGGSGSGSRYGGFGSEEAGYGGYSGGVYGDGGGFGGDTSGGFSDASARRDRFEEYDEGDDGEVSAPARRKEHTSSASAPPKRESKKAQPAKAPEPVPDLLAWDDDPAPAFPSAGKQPATSTGSAFGDDDDDFDDFQSAAPAAPAAKSAAAPFNIGLPASTSTPTSSTQFAQPQPHSAAQNNNLNDLFATVSPPPAANKMASPPPMTAAQQYKAAGFQQAGPNYFTSVPVGQNTSQSVGSTPSNIKSPGIGGKPAAKSSGGDAFASLLSGAGAKSKTTTPTQRVTMADMAKQKTSAGLWGAPASSSSTPSNQNSSGSKPGGALGDLLG